MYQRRPVAIHGLMIQLANKHLNNIRRNVYQITVDKTIVIRQWLGQMYVLRTLDKQICSFQNETRLSIFRQSTISYTADIYITTVTTVLHEQFVTELNLQYVKLYTLVYWLVGITGQVLHQDQYFFHQCRFSIPSTGLQFFDYIYYFECFVCFSSSTCPLHPLCCTCVIQTIQL